MNKTDEEWKKELDPQQYRVLRKKATEPAFTGKLLHNKENGVYTCAGCGTELFSSDTKYDSGSGWPSFWTTLAKDKIVEIPDRALGMDRVEIVCKNCGVLSDISSKMEPSRLEWRNGETWYPFA